MPGDQLDRNDLISGINAVITKLRAAGQPAGIRILGGAVLALRYVEHGRYRTGARHCYVHAAGKSISFH